MKLIQPLTFSSRYFLSISFILLATTAGAQDKPLTTPKCNEFTFDASSSYDPDNEALQFLWNFGDGQTSAEPVISHAYNQSGIYDVTLTITDNSGLECATSEIKQKVLVNLPPQPFFNIPAEACANQPIDFDASQSIDDSSQNLSYNWNFGDGAAPDTQKKTSKTFTQGGDYTVTLTVKEEAEVCSSAKIAKAIHINEPPKAEAGEEEILRCVVADEDMVVNFDASNSSDANNDALTYVWDFGDGEKSDGIRVSHRFNKIDNFDVKLVVSDNTAYGCATGVDFIRVRFNESPKANAGEDAVACVNQDIAFDGSASVINKKGTVDATWRFDDGTQSNALTTVHAYAKPGKYQATLTLENQLNSMCAPNSDTKIITVNTPPTVKLTATQSACIGEEVYFDASSAVDADGDNLEYYWTFGDGTIITAGSKIAHTYAQGGTYRVNVIVDDGKESSCSTASDNVVVKINTPPVADSGTNLTCCVDKPSSFDASRSSDPDGDTLTYNWNFGDGTTSTDAVTNHSYTKSGSYNVKLTVNDNSGTSCSQASSGFTAEVNTSPVPVINIR